MREAKITDVNRWDVFKVKKEEQINKYIIAKHLSVKVKTIITKMFFKKIIDKVYEKFFFLLKSYFITRALIAYRRKYLFRYKMNNIDD